MHQKTRDLNKALLELKYKHIHDAKNTPNLYHVEIAFVLNALEKHPGYSCTKELIFDRFSYALPDDYVPNITDQPMPYTNTSVIFRYLDANPKPDIRKYGEWHDKVYHAADAYIRMNRMDMVERLWNATYPNCEEVITNFLRPAIRHQKPSAVKFILERITGKEMRAFLLDYYVIDCYQSKIYRMYSDLVKMDADAADSFDRLSNNARTHGHLYLPPLPDKPYIPNEPIILNRKFGDMTLLFVKFNEESMDVSYRIKGEHKERHKDIPYPSK